MSLGPRLAHWFIKQCGQCLRPGRGWASLRLGGAARPAVASLPGYSLASSLVRPDLPKASSLPSGRCREWNSCTSLHAFSVLTS